MGSTVAKRRWSAASSKCCVADDDAVPRAGRRQKQLGSPFWTRPHANGALAQSDGLGAKDDQQGGGGEEEECRRRGGGGEEEWRRSRGGNHCAWMRH